MLADYPTTFNNWTLPKMKEWKVKPKDIVASYQTESGEDDVNYTRKDKITVNASVTAFDDVLQQLYMFYKMPSFTMKHYEPASRGFKERKMRFTSFDYDLLKNSDKITVTNGIYAISFTLEEF